MADYSFKYEAKELHTPYTLPWKTKPLFLRKIIEIKSTRSFWFITEIKSKKTADKVSDCHLLEWIKCIFLRGKNKELYFFSTG